MVHPTYEILIDYIENELPKAERVKVDDHLSQSCEECNAKLTQLRMVLDSIKEDKTIAPPPDVLRRAIATHAKQPTTPSRSLIQVLAELLFDSQLQLSPMAARGIARTRQMLFTTQQVDIDLHITPEHTDHNLTGQILGREQDDEEQYSTAFVSLQSDTSGTLKGTEADSLGQFTFKQIPPGVYDLVIDLGNQEVAIAGLELIND
ncbi:MAG: hypothetical protein JXB30_01185 [Anaerolineae bacterium]|nr:hypothetical protein [Anaerolineae bacterium]